MKFPKIRRMKDAAYAARKAGIVGPIEYRGTVKLHGTNGGVRLTADAPPVAQSRNRDLTLEHDNHGFAAFVLREREAFTRMLRIYKHPCDEMTVFGEWVGPGIQGGVALSQLTSKQFVMFAVAVDGEFLGLPNAPLFMLADADAGIYPVTDAINLRLSVDFGSPASVASASQDIQGIISDVEACCPWGALFGVEGIGEGVVWRPVGEHHSHTGLWFKSKGDKHAKGAKRSAQYSPSARKHSAQAAAFAETACTEERLRQGAEYLREVGKPVAMSSMGAYLKWLAGDVLDELGTDLADAGLEWKQVAKQVNYIAVAWFKGAAQ